MLLAAQKQNVVVYMSTGTGKTLIASLLIDSLLRRKVPHENDVHTAIPKKAIFIADKVALVEQQANFLRKTLSFKVGHFHGQILGTHVDFWDIRR